MQSTLVIIMANQYNSSDINSTFTKFIQVQFLVTLSEMCKFKYKCINEVIVKDGVVLLHYTEASPFK